nr:hypothetical protein [uncultured Flavobacterium sp.]
MKIFFKYYFVILIFIPRISSAQTNKVYRGTLCEINNEYYGKHLKGSVKRVFMKLNENERISSNKNLLKGIPSSDIQMYKYMFVDKYGSIKTIQRGETKNYSLEIDVKDSQEYQYDESDRITKSKYKTSLKPYYPVSNKNLLVKFNKKYIQKNIRKDANGKVVQEYDSQLYVYNYDNLGKVVEEKEYIVYRFGEVIKDTLPNNEDLFTTKIFTYDSKGQVTNQKILGGDFSDEMPYTDMGTESPFCSDLQLQYKYDQQGRIIQTTMYGCEKIVAKEEYNYHSTKDYVEKVKYYVTGLGEISSPTRNFLKTFNEQGDIIEKEFIPNYPEQTLGIKKLYYTYEYDSYNNWIKCNMFLEGTLDIEPTFVAERKIEYYN